MEKTTIGLAEKNNDMNLFTPTEKLEYDLWTLSGNVKTLTEIADFSVYTPETLQIARDELVERASDLIELVFRAEAALDK